MDNAEEYCIGFKYYTLKHTNRGYNVSSGSDVSNSRAGKTKEELEEWKKKISQARKGENNPNYGKHLSEETKKKISKTMKGENAPWYGKHLSDEHRKKISKTMKGKHLRKVRAYTDSGSLDKIFNCMLEAGKELGVKCSGISKCCRGKAKYAGKYEHDGIKEMIYWEYVEENNIEVA